MDREDWDQRENGKFTKSSIVRNRKNIEEGARDLKKMDNDFETFSCLLQLTFKALPEYIKSEIEQYNFFF